MSSFYHCAPKSGLWGKILEHLIHKVREENGKTPTPSYGLVGSQSVNTVAANEDRGIDGEKTKGRKRHIVVDTMDNLRSVVVHAANIHDTKAGILPVRKAMGKYSTPKAFCADA